MRFQIAAVAAFAGLTFAAPQAAAAAVQTVTTYSTEEITITSCAETVTECPARTTTNTYAVITTYPVNAGALFPTGALYPSGTVGTGNAGAYATGASTYHVPSPSATSGYTGPSFTGAGNQLVAGGALAGIGAVAALLI